MFCSSFSSGTSLLLSTVLSNIFNTSSYMTKHNFQSFVSFFPKKTEKNFRIPLHSMLLTGHLQGAKDL